MADLSKWTKLGQQLQGDLRQIRRGSLLLGFSNPLNAAKFETMLRLLEQNQLDDKINTLVLKQANNVVKGLLRRG